MKERIAGDFSTHTAALQEKEREETERVKNREMDGEGKETDNLVMYSPTIDRSYTKRIYPNLATGPQRGK
jgi:hypothetical protein